MPIPLCHSDRGFQYTNRAFHAKLEAVGMTQSMSRVAKCIDNGPMEGFWGIMKRERYYGKRFTSRTSLVNMVESYIEYYNKKRLQRNLGVLLQEEKHDNICWQLKTAPVFQLVAGINFIFLIVY